MSVKKHFGVYGICINKNKLLCIMKNGGPYNCRFDLPGGSQKNGESLVETLEREILEETGFTIKSLSNNRIFDVFVKPIRDETVHHVFAVYDITVDENNAGDIDKILDNEVNDSNGVFWVDINDLTINNASPLILRLLNQNTNFEAGE